VEQNNAKSTFGKGGAKTTFEKSWAKSVATESLATESVGFVINF